MYVILFSKAEIPNDLINNIAEITKKTEEIDDSECSVNLNNETTNKKKNTINGNKYLNPIYFKHQ